jgi:micrococcal nuclease
MALPWLVTAALVAAIFVSRHDRAFPSFDGAPRARVQRVVDGDTVRLAGLGSVRLIGINTPEVYGRVQCFGPEASAFAKSVLRRGTEVRYRVGTEPRDRYGRLLAYVYRADDDAFVNARLVQAGYARTLTIPPNVRFAGRFAALARTAREQRRGLWRAC